MQQPYFELAHLTRDDVAEIAAEAILVLPTAATEQHGPHLPLGTDSIIGEGVARAALSAAGTDSPLVLAPVLPYGSSHHHLIYSTLSLGTSTYLASVNDLLDTAFQSGFRRMFALNSHGGNADLVRLAARDTALARDAVIGSCSYWDVSMPALLQARAEATWPVPGHAGQLETSVMLALRPELVRLDRLGSKTHSLPIRAGVTLPGYQLHAQGDWARMDGVTDVPRAPSAELGNRFLGIVATSVAEALEEFDGLSLGQRQRT